MPFHLSPAQGTDCAASGSTRINADFGRTRAHVRPFPDSALSPSPSLVDALAVAGPGEFAPWRHGLLSDWSGLAVVHLIGDAHEPRGSSANPGGERVSALTSFLECLRVALHLEVACDTVGIPSICI